MSSGAENEEEDAWERRKTLSVAAGCFLNVCEVAEIFVNPSLRRNLFAIEKGVSQRMFFLKCSVSDEFAPEVIAKFADSSKCAQTTIFCCFWR